jgi:hypothetical protein
MAVSNRIPAVTGNRSGTWRGGGRPLAKALEALRTGVALRVRNWDAAPGPRGFLRSDFILSGTITVLV